MLALCIDIGAGTQDVLVYEAGSRIENSLKLVLPTPTVRLGKQVARMTGDVFVNGRIIGGGPVVRAMKDHIASGNCIYITKEAAATVRDNLLDVAAKGFTIVEGVENADLTLDEFDFESITPLISAYYPGQTLDVVAVAAQDHGYTAGQSDRMTRFLFLKQFLAGGLRSACFRCESEIPPHFTRWQSLATSIRERWSGDILLTDTAVIAALGAASITNHRPVISIDAGNAHTFAALIGEGDRILGFFEHHTGSLTPERAAALVRKLSRSEVTFDEVFAEEGHGAHVFEQCMAEGCPVLVTGPKRGDIFADGNAGVRFAAPAGDMMMTGPVGLLMQLGAL